MNLPNKLTMLRMFMIPFFLLFFFWQDLPLNYFWSLLIFAAASLTDMLDGNIARKHGLITDFGKLMDPLADKLLVVSALCCLLMEKGTVAVICLILILSREFLVTSIRLIAAGKGEVLAADNWGKAKTVTQMVWICLQLLLMSFLWDSPAVFSVLYTAATVLFYAMVALTVLSGVHYVWKNRGLFADA